MISLADFQPLSIAKINIFQQQPRFYSQICIVWKSMLVKRSRSVDTLRDAASFCSLSSFIEYLNYVHLQSRARFATYSSISPVE